MTIEGFSIQQLNKVIEDSKGQIENIKRQDIRDEISKIILRLTEMKVALLEIEHVENEFHRGNIITEIYLDRHKKLVKDFYFARDGISNDIIPKMTNLEIDENQKGKLFKFRDYLKSNKDFLLNISQLILTIAQIFGKTV